MKSKEPRNSTIWFLLAFLIVLVAAVVAIWKIIDDANKDLDPDNYMGQQIDE